MPAPKAEGVVEVAGAAVEIGVPKPVEPKAGLLADAKGVVAVASVVEVVAVAAVVGEVVLFANDAAAVVAVVVAAGGVVVEPKAEVEVGEPKLVAPKLNDPDLDCCCSCGWDGVAVVVVVVVVVVVEPNDDGDPNAGMVLLGVVDVDVVNEPPRLSEPKLRPAPKACDSEEVNEGRVVDVVPKRGLLGAAEVVVVLAASSFVSFGVVSFTASLVSFGAVATFVAVASFAASLVVVVAGSRLNDAKLIPPKEVASAGLLAVIGVELDVQVEVDEEVSALSKLKPVVVEGVVEPKPKDPPPKGFEEESTAAVGLLVVVDDVGEAAAVEANVVAGVLGVMVEPKLAEPKAKPVPNGFDCCDGVDDTLVVAAVEVAGAEKGEEIFLVSKLKPAEPKAGGALAVDGVVAVAVDIASGTAPKPNDPPRGFDCC